MNQNLRIEKLRKEVRICDEQLLEILKKRFIFCLQLKELKKQINAQTRQQDIEDKLKLFWLSKEDKTLTSDFLEKLLELILRQSRKLQDKL